MQRQTKKIIGYGVALVLVLAVALVVANMACNSAYDGQDVSVLLKDIKKYKKEWGLR